jgi:hypothetical protein
MKKLVMLLGAAVMAVPAPFVVSAPAHAAANPAVDYCRQIVASGELPNLTLGNCVALLTTVANYENGLPGDGYATQVCRLYEQNYPEIIDDEFGGYSACVLALHDAVQGG